MESKIVEAVCVLLMFLGIIAWFWFMGYIGRSKTEKRYKKKIKDAEPEIKELFDQGKQLPGDIIFFTYMGDSRGNIVIHIILIVFALCLIPPIVGMTLGKVFRGAPDALIMTLVVLVILLFIYWRYAVNRRFKKELEEGRHRYGLFLLRDKLVVRQEGSDICEIIPKSHINVASDCCLWTSDTSEDNGIKIIVSPDSAEIIILGEFLSVFRDQVVEKIQEWLSKPEFNAESN